MILPLITAFIAIMFTQFIKYPIAYIRYGKQAKLDIITATGGMPSSHSAAVSSLITSLIIENGFNSPSVAVATVLGVIVMFDSMGVRRQSGEQGILLDYLAKKYMENNPDVDRILEEYDHLIIKKYLGHKPTEVIVGTLTGCFVAIVCHIIVYGLIFY